MALNAVEAMRFLYFQILFQTADIVLLLSNIVPKVCLLVILHRESAQLVQEIVKLEILMLMSFFYWRCSIRKGEVGLLKEKFNTDNQSEAIRLAILQSLATGDFEKVKTLFGLTS